MKPRFDKWVLALAGVFLLAVVETHFVCHGHGDDHQEEAPCVCICHTVIDVVPRSPVVAPFRKPVLAGPQQPVLRQRIEGARIFRPPIA